MHILKTFPFVISFVVNSGDTVNSNSGDITLHFEFWVNSGDTTLNYEMLKLWQD